jgi:hypothetical protein
VKNKTFKIPERIIELQSLEYLSYFNGLAAIKLKDQARVGRDGAYRRPSKYAIRGVSDIVILLPESRVIWIEIKTKVGRQSVDQKVFQKMCYDLGHEYHIVRSLDDLKKILISHGILLTPSHH